MIGGVDIEIPTQLGAAALDRSARTVLRAWPQAVFVSPETGEKLHDVDALSLSTTRELLVYRDASVEERWELEGAIPELRDTLVHLLADDDLITVVVDDPDSVEMGPIVAALRTELANREDLPRNGSQHQAGSPDDRSVARH